MKKYIITILILTLITLLGVGCTNKSNNPGTDQTTTLTKDADSTEEASAPSNDFIPEKISAADAKEMMDNSKDLVILDVRTQEEFEEGHIEGAILIPDNEIKSKAEDILTDKNAIILVYCRSGRRSALASQTLSDLGYTSIYDFGGIIDWPYEVVGTN